MGDEDLFQRVEAHSRRHELAGDPVALGAEMSSLQALARELELPSLEGAGVLSVGPRVALIHSLTGAVDGLAVRVVRLAHAAERAADVEDASAQVQVPPAQGRRLPDP